MEIYDYPPDSSIGMHSIRHCLTVPPTVDDSEGRLNRYEGRRDSGSGSSTPASGDGTSTGNLKGVVFILAHTHTHRQQQNVFGIF